MIELEAIYHQPGWVPLPEACLRRKLAALVAGEGWVVDGNGAVVPDIFWPVADTIVWLDLPCRVVMRRVGVRTLLRVALRKELWNGNREGWRNLIDRRPAENMILRA